MKLAVTIVPGHMQFTRMPSLARLFDRFFVTLLNAAFEAVYATIRGFCRWIECADNVTMRAHSAARSIGSAARIDRTPDIVPSANAASHCASSISSK